MVISSSVRSLVVADLRGDRLGALERAAIEQMP